MIHPRPRAFIAGSRARISRKTPVRLVSTMAAKSSGVVSSTGAMAVTPAAGTTRSAAPQRAPISSAQRSSATASRTSQGRMSPPCPLPGELERLLERRQPPAQQRQGVPPPRQLQGDLPSQAGAATAHHRDAARFRAHPRSLSAGHFGGLFRRVDFGGSAATASASRWTASDSARRPWR